MREAKIAGTKPIIVELDPGQYFWCRCGRSIDQPYCDGSHAGARGNEKQFEPLPFSVSEKKKYALCTCKQTATPPFCDGAHKRIAGSNDSSS